MALDQRLHCGLMRASRLLSLKAAQIGAPSVGGIVRLKRFMIGAVGLVALAGCGSLPNDGPSAKLVEQHVKAEGAAGYSLIDLDYAATQAIASTPRPVPVGLADASSDAPTDLISDGDVLGVTIFESGATPLFARSATAVGASGQDTFPRVVVDRNGSIELPFIGQVYVRGLTADAAGTSIRNALKGRAVDPQVLVNVLTSPANSVSVLGEVRTPGRFPVSANNDRLLDIIASAGGTTKPIADVKVVVARGTTTLSAPLSLLLDDSAQNIRLAPHDQVRLLSYERKYSTFGAFGRVTEAPIVDQHLSLAAAISRSGGLDTYSADNSAVFVFRFERPEVAQTLAVHAVSTPKGTPVVYRLDMRDPNAYFVASSFEIQPDDILFVPRASSVGVRKFLDLVSVVTNVAYTAAVTSANAP